jgi:hypothetical protein
MLIVETQMTVEHTPQTIAESLSVAEPLVEEHVKAVEAHGFYLRGRSGFDLVMGAMYRRVIEAIKSTFILMGQGQDADAVVTARVALEHRRVFSAFHG